MKNLQSGQNTKLEIENFKVKINCSINLEVSTELDVSAFLLGSDEKVRSDDDFIFYNQPTTKDNALKLDFTKNEKQFFTLNLNKLENDVQKIIFVITSPLSYKSASSLSIEIENNLIFEPIIQNMQEKSLILGQLYRHGGGWKFRALGQGFNKGLAPLAIKFGVEIDDEPKIVPEPIKKIPTPPKLTKSTINLKKVGEKTTISLSKGTKITAKLKWDTNADLDLYCFYVDTHNNEDKVYYKKLGNSNNLPFIKLLGDSQMAGEEVIEITKQTHIKYVLIAAYSAVSNGVGSFYSYKARVIVTDNEYQEVVSHLSHKDPYSYWVAFSFIDFTKLDEITIENVETYSNKKTFKKQFEERTGEKLSSIFKSSKATVNGVNLYDPERSPYLFKDGTFMMSVGDREFK